MSEDPDPFDSYIHLLAPRDLEPETPAGEVVRADGSRQQVSADLLAAIDHLLSAVEANRSILIQPLSQQLWFVEAIGLTRMGEAALREHVAQGRLPTTASPAGDLVQLRDVVALERESRAARAHALRELLDDPLADAELDVDDGDS